MSLPKLTFVPKGKIDFYTDIRQEVKAYFEDNNLSTHADWRMVSKTLIIFGVYFGAYALILSNFFTPWAMLGLAIVMGMGMAGIGMSIAHDSIHGAYFKQDWANLLLGYSMNLVGGSQYVWKITHNLVHHTYTNVHEYDEDLEIAPILRLSPRAPHWGIHRFQQYFGWVLYAFATLFWVFIKDYRKMLKPNIGCIDNRKHPVSEVAILIGLKLFYYTYMIVIPLLVLHIAWWQFIIGFVALHMTAGLILGVIFSLAHIVEECAQPVPGEEGSMENTWAVHQMLTTADFAPHNKFITWYVGGLNFQTVHHLFPKVCSVHYPAISRILVKVAARHNVPYNMLPTFGMALRSHYRTLKNFGSGVTEMTPVAPVAFAYA